MLKFHIFSIHLDPLRAESAPEEPGDEGADGPDEEPAVGRERHADPAEVTRRGYFERGTPSSWRASCPSPHVVVSEASGT